MAPPHVASFQRFNALIPNHLEAGVAFGLFMESERIWAAGQGNPSDTRYRNYQAVFLTDHEIGRYAQQARDFLKKFGTDAVAAKQPQFLQESLQRYEAAAQRGHSGFRRWGIIEAAIGALFWTLVLIFVIIPIANYASIDLVEIVHKVTGH